MTQSPTAEALRIVASELETVCREPDIADLAQVRCALRYVRLACSRAEKKLMDAAKETDAKPICPVCENTGDVQDDYQACEACGRVNPIETMHSSEDGCWFCRDCVAKWNPENDAASTEAASGDGQAGHCPKCDSPAPHLHPAVQHEGEVQICEHQFHNQVTSQNSAPRDGGPSPTSSTPAGTAERCSTCGGNITRTAEGAPIHTDFSCADDRRDVFAAWNRRASPTPAVVEMDIAAMVRGLRDLDKDAPALPDFCNRVADALLALRAEVHNVRGLFNTASATAKEEHERAKAAEGRLAQAERERDQYKEGHDVRCTLKLMLGTDKTIKAVEELQARAAKLEAALRAFPEDPNPFIYSSLHAAALAALTPPQAEGK